MDKWVIENMRDFLYYGCSFESFLSDGYLGFTLKNNY